MPEIRWHPEAVVDLERLQRFLDEATGDTTVSQKAARKLLRELALLQGNPLLGRRMEASTTRRELVVSFGAGAYVVRYVATERFVAILRVWHARENWPDK